ncbi:MAG TPA: Nramp family divalent metal transporter [Gemmatimonadaceae bacterium]|jgi:Mn2+/Fe2+ NRAMP family transporter|nr:Nramp family divalent metal transporter [Gemmatimonadaceae bacterium]
MKKIFQITLGIVTSVGGFLEIGSITTAAQAGASFGYQLVWAILLGTLCIAFLVEMSGRFAAVSKHTIPDAMRERFGINFYVVPLFVMLGVSLLVLGAEMGGVAAALEMATGIKLPIWAIPVALISWGLLWRATFSIIENGVSLLGLVTVAFAIGAMKLHPDYGAVARGAVPTLPRQDAAHYWFVAVSVLGASISPYLYYFYSSGAIEEKWDETYLAANRAIAAIGMGFGGFLSVAVLVLAAILFHPHNIDVDKYQQLPGLLTPIFGRTGFWLVIASLAIACLGATLEISLALAYLIAQGLGWNWGEDLEPRDDARFSLSYTLIVAAAMLFVLVGVDPLKLTEISMALTAASLPVGVFPFLILMNDKKYLQTHTNGYVGNAVVLAISVMAAVLAIVSIPLEIVGG